MFKRILCVLLTILLLVSLCGCVGDWIGIAVFSYLTAIGDNRASKAEIFSLVLEQEDVLRNAVETQNFTAFESSSIIQSIDPYDGSVKFYCGARGISVSGMEVGFYYAPNGRMTDIYFAPDTRDQIHPCGDGYDWCGGFGCVYVEKICENFYYYELSY